MIARWVPGLARTSTGHVSPTYSSASMQTWPWARCHERDTMVWIAQLWIIAHYIFCEVELCQSPWADRGGGDFATMERFMEHLQHFDWFPVSWWIFKNILGRCSCTHRPLPVLSLPLPGLSLSLPGLFWVLRHWNSWCLSGVSSQAILHKYGFIILLEIQPHLFFKSHKPWIK